MANTPNHQQTAKIARDISALKQGRPVEDWHGNSYKGHIYGDHYRLIHWNTAIATFDSTGRCVYFNTEYISATTRSFQGRILAAMRDEDPMTAAIRVELGKPTGDRGRIYIEDLYLSA